MKKILFAIALLLPGVAQADTCATNLGIAFPASQKNALCNDFGGSVNISQVPASNNSINLGSSSKQWSNAYIGTKVIFGAGAGETYTPYVPTAAATPVAGTNIVRPGLNVVPTNAANNALFIGPATPVPGDHFIVSNNAGAAIRLKAAGGATLNGATAGGYISVASLATVECFTQSATNQVCLQPVIPTPAGP